ncbi:MAG: recombinase family protein [Paludibacteraceae bacterium]|jgi:DNA invertase Pin-like site-specific DNA recombinase|nr:recombinase family protein [Paludibacteraceae bacterium]
MTAVIYARVSSTTDRQTTDRQVADLMTYAAANQMQVVRVFEEKISGAKQNKERQVLQETLEYCRQEKVDYLLSNELSRIGRNTFNVLETIKFLIDSNINLYLQKEKFTLLQDNGKPSPFAAVMLATLSTCAELERENISFRLQSGRKQYIEKGGKLGRKDGSCKTTEKKKEEYAEVLRLLKKGISIRNTARLTDVGISTVQRLKKEFEIE